MVWSLVLAAGSCGDTSPSCLSQLDGFMKRWCSTLFIDPVASTEEPPLLELSKPRLLRFARRCHLNLNGMNVVRFRSVHSKYFKLAATVPYPDYLATLRSRWARANVYGTYRSHPQTVVRLAWVGLLFLPHHGLLTARVSGLGGCDALNQVQTAVTGRSQHIDGVIFHGVMLLAGRALRFRANGSREFA